MARSTCLLEQNLLTLTGTNLQPVAFVVLGICTPPALKREPFQGTDRAVMTCQLITSSGSPALTKRTAVFSEFTFHWCDFCTVML